jgi:hypothetical protein
MTIHDLPSPEELRQLLMYEAATGKLYWKPRPLEMFKDMHLSNGGCRKASVVCHWWNTRFAGKEAFTSRGRGGYPSGAIRKKYVAAHRAAWCLYYGEWPDQFIDHVNRDRTDNRIANLRVVDNRTNCKNQKLRRTNTSGVMGVRWHRTKKRWDVSIGNRFVGSSANKTEAINMRLDAEKTEGYHPNHGKVPTQAVALQIDGELKR